jgi:electron transport complex protein RnfB
MSESVSRRDAIGRVVRGTAAVGLAGGAIYLAKKAGGQVVWQVNASRCINSRLDEIDVEVCQLCTTKCVVSQSAVRAVNDFSKCGRCYICPAYFNVQSAVDENGLPSEKLCPRDAIIREPIGWIDPDDPANNFYEYTIDETKCDGCGKCVMACKEPAGLSSIRLMVRHDLCVDCNQCAISTACPKDAITQFPPEEATEPQEPGPRV